MESIEERTRDTASEAHERSFVEAVAEKFPIKAQQPLFEHIPFRERESLIQNIATVAPAIAEQIAVDYVNDARTWGGIAGIAFFPFLAVGVFLVAAHAAPLLIALVPIYLLIVLRGVGLQEKANAANERGGGLAF